MYAFDYQKPSSVADAVAALKAADDGKFVAGGMTLIPTLKQRLAQPSHLIDLGGVTDLVGITVAGNGCDHRGDDHPRGGREIQGGRGRDPGAGGPRRRHRRPAGPQPRHHRRLGCQQRSGRRLSGRLPGARGHHQDRPPRTEGGGLLHRPVRDRPRRRRDHRLGVVPEGREGRLHEVRQPGIALRAGRRVRRQDRRRRPGGGHRLGPERRVPGARDGEGAVRHLVARRGRRGSRSTPAR